MYDVIVVGGGLAGLTAASYAVRGGKRTLLLEKSVLGGRSMSVSLKGYTFNLGAHAVYGRDRTVLPKVEKELGLSLSWVEYQAQAAKYLINNSLYTIPSTPLEMLKTNLYNSAGKMSIIRHVCALMMGWEQGQEGISFVEWMEKKGYHKEAKMFFIQLMKSNFFTKEPESLPSRQVCSYYRDLFKTQTGVSYLQGGWGTWIETYRSYIESNGGEIATKTKIVSMEREADVVLSVTDSKGNRFEAKRFIFCIPPAELCRLFGGKEDLFTPYNGTPLRVMYYDVALSERIERTYTYVQDLATHQFVTDISAYDMSCVPEGGQLLQCMMYLREGEDGKETKEKEFENLLDTLYEGWRDRIVTTRVSKGMNVQECRWDKKQQGMPIQFPDFENVRFAGDWCEGNGYLSVLAVESARRAVTEWL